MDWEFQKRQMGEVLDMAGPLGFQLQGLHFLPLHTIDQDPLHVLLVLGCAYQVADALGTWDCTFLSLVFLGKNLPILSFSLVTTVMNMVGLALTAPLPGSLLTWRGWKVHLSMFLTVDKSLSSTSLSFSVGLAAIQ